MNETKGSSSHDSYIMPLFTGAAFVSGHVENCPDCQIDDSPASWPSSPEPFCEICYLLGGFQLEFVSISRVINHYKFECSHWLKLQHSDLRANLVKDFFVEINFPPMRALE